MNAEATDREARGSSEPEERVEDRIGKGDVIDEVATLTRKLTTAVDRVWDSEQRRSVQRRVVEELRTAGDHVERLAREAGSTTVGHELTEGAEKIGRQLGEGLLSGLRALNRELSRVIEKHDAEKKG